MKWVRIQSWHAIKVTSRGGMIQTACGRWMHPDADVADDLPTEKSCETCLRIVARQADQS